MKDLLEQAIELNNNKEFQKVVDLLSEEVLAESNNSEIYSEAAQAYWRLNRYEESKVCAEKSWELNQSNPRAYHYLGNYYSKDKNEYEKAKENYFKAIELNRFYPYPYIGLGNLFSSSKEYEKAKEYHLKAIDIDDSLVYPYLGLGNIYYFLKDYSESKRIYLIALQKDNSIAEVYNGLGNVYLMLEDIENAKITFLKAIQIDNECYKPQNGLGIAYFRIKDFKRSEVHFLKALETTENKSFALNNLGLLYYGIKEYEKAKNYFKESLKSEFDNPRPHFNLGLLYFHVENNYSKAKYHFNEFLKLNNDPEEIFQKRALLKVEEIDKILENSTYNKVNNLIERIKDLLKFKGECVTHYTGISTVQFLVLKESPLRLSEGSYLNDTSEGKELFDYLNYNSNSKQNPNEYGYAKRPFIGSFVDVNKNNNLTLWRMYGKEALEEAKGCSITLNIEEFKNAINEKISPSKSLNISNTDDIEFYRVVYRNADNFEFADSCQKQKDSLTELMKELKVALSEFKNKSNKLKNEEIDIIELLNEIAYLFKSAEYHYENEIRLVINEAVGFDKKIDIPKGEYKPSSLPPKVYIELVPVNSLLKTITIGPKVEKAEEWAATFHYSLLNQGFKPDIQISTLPFK